MKIAMQLPSEMPNDLKIKVMDELKTLMQSKDFVSAKVEFNSHDCSVDIIKKIK